MSASRKNRKTRKQKLLRFADCVIIACVTVMLYLTVSTVRSYRTIGLPIPSDVLRELIRFWGGELLIIALRQVLGSDIVDRIHPGSGSSGSAPSI